MLHQLAQSHADNLEMKIEALKLQGQNLTFRRVSENPLYVRVTGRLPDETILREFNLDKFEEQTKCALFTQELTKLSKSLPLPMGQTAPLGGAA